MTASAHCARIPSSLPVGMGRTLALRRGRAQWLTVVLGAVALLVYWTVSHFIGWLLIGLTIWVATFFRDPIRTSPRGDKFILGFMSLMRYFR